MVEVRPTAWGQEGEGALLSTAGDRLQRLIEDILEQASAAIPVTADAVMVLVLKLELAVIGARELNDWHLAGVLLQAQHTAILKGGQDAIDHLAKTCGKAGGH